MSTSENVIKVICVIVAIVILVRWYSTITRILPAQTSHGTYIAQTIERVATDKSGIDTIKFVVFKKGVVGNDEYLLAEIPSGEKTFYLSRAGTTWFLIGKQDNKHYYVVSL